VSTFRLLESEIRIWNLEFRFLNVESEISNLRLDL